MSAFAIYAIIFGIPLLVNVIMTIHRELNRDKNVTKLLRSTDKKKTQIINSYFKHMEIQKLVLYIFPIIILLFLVVYLFGSADPIALMIAGFALVASILTWIDRKYTKSVITILENSSPNENIEQNEHLDLESHHLSLSYRIRLLISAVVATLILLSCLAVFNFIIWKDDKLEDKVIVSAIGLVAGFAGVAVGIARKWNDKAD